MSLSMLPKNSWRGSQNYFILLALKNCDSYELGIDKGNEYVKK